MVSARGARFLENLQTQRRTLAHEVEGDVQHLRSLTLTERGHILESVCRDTMAILQARVDGAAVLAALPERSPHWDSVVARSLHGRD